MNHTEIVTAFIQNRDRLLILKRSNHVRSMRGLWSAVSGIIEGSEDPLDRARTEIYEEVGMSGEAITLARSAKRMRIRSPQYRNHAWDVFPFLFEARKPRVSLNWENSDYRWIKREQLGRYKTVPSLDAVLASLL